MTGASTVQVSDAARALIAATMGDNPTIVVDGLTGGASKGEAVVSGPLSVVDEPHPSFVGVVKNRVVKIGGVVVYGPVMVAEADVLTHAKAANMLRSFASVGGYTVRASTSVARAGG